jgi:ATP-dependent Lon protease
LQKLAADDRLGYRSPRPTAEVADAILAIGAAAPNFADLVDLFVTRIRAGLFRAAAFRPSPILLVAPPGVGKSFVRNEIAIALGSVFHSLSMVNENAVNPFAGTDRVWRAARIGVVARLLIEGTTDAPLILVDEIDKPARVGGILDSPVDALFALLEPYQAARFRDNLLDIEFAADAVIWIASANEVACVPPPVVDRFTVIHVDPPTPSHALAVLRSIYAGVIARY